MNAEQKLEPGSQERVVAALTRMADDAYETELIDLLFDLDEGPVTQFWIDEARGPDEEDYGRSIERVNLFCETMGISPTVYDQNLIRGTIKNIFSGDTFDAARARKAQRHGVTIGQLLVDASIAALPIENDEEGSGSVRVVLHNTDLQRVITVESEGFYWTEYAPEDLDEDSTIGWSIRYTASIQPSDQKDV